MAKSILTGEPFSRNDISKLAHYFEQSFDYYLNNHSPFFNDYLKSLRTIVGLGFTAALADHDLLSTYQHYLERFIAMNEGDFRVNPGAKRGIAQAVAEMVNTGGFSFYALKFPRYYHDFYEAVCYTLVQTPKLSGEPNEVERLVAQLTIR